MMTEAESLSRDLVYRDVIGEAIDEEAAILRRDENVRKWYATLKLMRQETERDLAEVKRSAKLTARKTPLYGRADELGLEISWINASLSEARELVKDLNVRETAAKAKKKTTPPPEPSPPPPLPSDPVIITDDAQLRADLRAAQRMMRRCFDFMRDDANVTFRAMDARDALMQDLARELRGT